MCVLLITVVASNKKLYSEAFSHWGRQVVWDSPPHYADVGMTTFCGTVCLTGNSQSTITEGSERWHFWNCFCCCLPLSASVTTLLDGLCILKDSWSWWVVWELPQIDRVSLIMFFFFFKVTVDLLSHHNIVMYPTHLVPHMPPPHTPSLLSPSTHWRDYVNKSIFKTTHMYLVPNNYSKLVAQ